VGIDKAREQKLSILQFHEVFIAASVLCQDLLEVV
jgi:hypothetical protein